jgi:hypothetical protein
MENVLVLLAVLACPVGMGLCMWLMARGMRHDKSEPQAEVPPSIEQLREEQHRLESEIDRLEQKQGAR